MRLAEYWVRPMQSLIDGEPSARGTALAGRLERVRTEYCARHPSREPQEATARQRVLEFAARIEDEIAQVVRTHSIVYWLHAIRSFRPRIPSADPIVVFQTRTGVESAVQKYGTTGMCDGCAWSDEVAPEAIFAGLFAATADREAVAAVSRARMPVLTAFTRAQVDELDFLHQACEHLQRCLVVLRTMVWSGRLVVNDVAAFDLSLSADLVPLSVDMPIGLGPFAKRREPSEPIPVPPPDVVLLPAYTVIPRRPAPALLRRYAAPPDDDLTFAKAPLYYWHPVSLAETYRTSRPLEADFRRRNGCDLAAVLAVIGCLSRRATSQWHDPSRLITHWHHAFDAGVRPGQLTEDLLQLRPGFVAEVFGGVDVSEDGFLAAVDFLTLTEARRGGIDPLFGLPMFPLLPLEHGLVIDYGCLLRLVDSLFFRVRIGNAQFWS